jgi:short-subunit dehydrogenase involved in D-alanine esterification of teichoic acids
MTPTPQRIAAVTGANRGIGFEICRGLARLGIHTILTGRDERKAGKAGEKLAAEGLDVRPHQLDVADPESVERLREFVVAEYGRLDILVNNAALYIDDRHSLLTVDLEVMRSTMEVNVYGPLRLIQAFVPLMKQAGYGRIVNVSSGIGELSSLGPSYPAYPRPGWRITRDGDSPQRDVPRLGQDGYGRPLRASIRRRGSRHRDLAGDPPRRWPARQVLPRPKSDPVVVT